MADLNGTPGELMMTIKITRVETGKVDEVNLIGQLDKNQLKTLQTSEESETKEQ